MLEVPAAVAAKLPHLPESPGVYLWKDVEGTVLYVGKAKRLRSRVRSYFAADHVASVKTQHLVRLIAELDTIVVPSEAHALILEANLIKEYRPRFNIALRDDKSYPYIKVTLQEPFPRVFVTRRLVNDGGRYFGPYTDVGAMRRALNVVKRIFTVRSCHYALPEEVPDRPCLDYHIGKCKAPCVGYQGEPEYRAMIDEVVLFLDGRTAEVIGRVRERMLDASASLNFERAAELRDALLRLETLEEPTVVVQVEGGDRDVVGYARDGDDACVTILRVRGGKLLARDPALPGEHRGGGRSRHPVGLPGARIRGGRGARRGTPGADGLRGPAAAGGIAGDDAGRGAAARAASRARAAGGPECATPPGGVQARVVRGGGTRGEPVYDLQRELGLQKLPRAFVCFDISTAQGTDTVGSCVWFENGRPRRAEYRKFKVKTVEGTDDFASMREVVGRYFGRRMEEGKALPDLVVVDGGKGQLNAAHEALEALGLGDLPSSRSPRRRRRSSCAGAASPSACRAARRRCARCSRRATRRIASPSRTTARAARCGRSPPSCSRSPASVRKASGAAAGVRLPARGQGRDARRHRRTPRLLAQVGHQAAAVVAPGGARRPGGGGDLRCCAPRFRRDRRRAPGFRADR